MSEEEYRENAQFSKITSKISKEFNKIYDIICSGFQYYYAVPEYEMNPELIKLPINTLMSFIKEKKIHCFFANFLENYLIPAFDGSKTKGKFIEGIVEILSVEIEIFSEQKLCFLFKKIVENITKNGKTYQTYDYVIF